MPPPRLSTDAAIALKRELVAFLVVGSTSVLIDFLIYSGLVRSALVGVSIAKASSFLVGVVFTYLANRFWTFGRTKHRPGSPWRYCCVCSFTLSANVLVNAISLRLLHGVPLAIPIAYLMATGASASLNFIGFKWFVFTATIAAEVE